MKTKNIGTEGLKAALKSVKEEARRELEAHKQKVAFFKAEISRLEGQIKEQEWLFLGKIRNAVQDGVSMTKIANEHGVSRTAVVNWNRMASG